MLLPDKRLQKVLDIFIDRISQKQTLSMRKLANARREEIQFGRFIGNQRVEVKELETHLYKQAAMGCQQSEHILLIEDSSQMSFTLSNSIEGLGKVDKGQVKGFYLHPVLSMDADTGACHGIAALEFHTRIFEQEKLDKKTVNALRRKIPFEHKEGFRWYSSIEKALSNCTEPIKKTVIADRESDIFPVLVGLQQDLEVDYIIRSKNNRPLEQGIKLYEKINSWSVKQSYDISLPATDKRSAHKAKLMIKFGQVILNKAEGKTIKQMPATHSCWAIEVKECPDSVVGTESPVHWILLTSHGLDSFEKALQIIDWYKQRWNIEQVFRALKNKGLRIESSQVSNYERLQKVTILALMGAVKVLQLVRARNGDTGQNISEAFDEHENKLLIVLNKQLEGNTEKLKNPHAPMSLGFAAWIIARLGGWSGYKSQRPPGPIDFLTGLQRFNERLEGYKLANET
jgi:hypothetical protein